MRVCLVVPHYQHAESFKAFLPRLIGLDLPIIVVDDGSDQQNLTKLKGALEDFANVALIQHERNLGKGAAMMSGARMAAQQGFTHMLQIDADGQHDVADVQRFVDAAKQFPHAIISGLPQFDASAPKARVYGRRVTDFWVMLETWSRSIRDSLCGFRIYPLAEFEQVCTRHRIGRRMDFDTEILVKSSWMGIQTHFLTTQVVYVDGNISHFHYLRDNVRLIWLHARLMVGMLVRAPVWLIRRARSLVI